MSTNAGARFAIVRVLSKLGYCSRMQAVDLVLGGHVAMDGRVVRDPGTLCGFDRAITVDGKPVRTAGKRYVLLNKPRGVVTTRNDERGRTTVYDLLQGMDRWLAPVGRLDRDTEGLLLLTNDTQYAALLTDPRNAVPRVYRATIRPGMSQAEIDALVAGVKIDDGLTVVPRAASLVESGQGWTTVEITLTEGRNHVVRRLFRARARRVLGLRRTRFGPFEIGELEPGGWREVEAQDPRAP